MLINQTIENGRNTFEFEANNTAYTVIETSEIGFYEVWSNRLNVSFPPKVAVMSLSEMSKRSKALKALVDFATL